MSITIDLRIKFQYRNEVYVGNKPHYSRLFGRPMEDA